ncbi:MAG: Asp-tRNA(Asn)/Glu-tRNA(Gln) amidotransferase subunit GatB [Clostridiaceae bacterium]|nr:Asp-tRNA(Asn)/Glu-tRNA(Gln) amidotransferase subunit GatB [Clostridiaceae bacterium]
MSFETVIGLEVHVELLSETKVFCTCKSEFGGKPNTRICEVCTGMPGTLPRLNEKVVEFAVKTGLATDCEVTKITRFDRKNYFYPDLPKAYQISQLYLPICRNGHVEIQTENGKKIIGIHEIHIEEDAGKLIHTESGTLIDYNRCGVPLLEIVTEPDFSDADEVIAFLEALKRILTYLGVSDCKMQEGSMRADVNLSVRSAGSRELGTRTEMKNLNSFHDIADAVKSEAARQIALIKSGEAVIQQTRRWDADMGESYAMRSKEAANDYRYFPEPDIPPIDISESFINRINSALPELPAAKKRRYINELGLSDYDASVLTNDIYVVGFFESALKDCSSPKEVANWVLGEVLRLLKDSGTDSKSNPLKPEALVKIIEMVQSGKINRNTGKAVLEKAFYDGVDVERYISENGLSLITDSDRIKAAVEAVIADNEKSVTDYKRGKTAALGYLVGQTMKALGGRADANEIQKLLREMLD